MPQKLGRVRKWLHSDALRRLWRSFNFIGQLSLLVLAVFTSPLG